MKTTTLTATSLAALALATVANAQQIDTVATETFDYDAGADIDQLAGDFGWFQQWFAGGAGVIDVPGLDAVGGAANTTGNNAGAFRSPKTGPWVQTVADGFNFGGGNGTMWVSFTSQRPASSDSRYGGLSLHTSFVGEKLFIGSPFESNEWGVAIPGVGDFRVAGSDVTQATRIVCRIDYQTGDERFRMWLDPGVANPTSSPDLDVTVADHNWNEIRLQSGEGLTANGWLWDDIVIECQDCVPNSLLTDVASINAILGGTANLQGFAGLENEGDIFAFIGSVSGTAPGTPIGAITVPLNLDAYALLTLQNPAAGGLTNGFGNLDLDGRCFSSFTLPSNLGQLSGSTVSFAYVVIDTATFSLSLASEAVSINLL